MIAQPAPLEEIITYLSIAATRREADTTFASYRAQKWASSTGQARMYPRMYLDGRLTVSAATTNSSAIAGSVPKIVTFIGALVASPILREVV